MMIKQIIKMGSIGLLMLSSVANAKVGVEDSNKLGNELTFVGAEKQGNAEGTVPAWTGGYQASVKDGELVDPYPDDKVLFIIDSSNMKQFKDNLSPGQVGLLEKYPDTFKINVYQSRRTAAYPQKIYDKTRENATSIELNEVGSGLLGDYVEGVPFPIPQHAIEILWNHITRYRGGQVDRIIDRIAPQRNGQFIPYKLWQNMAFSSNIKDARPSDNILFYFVGENLAPARTAGSLTLVHETLDQVKDPRQAWSYSSGQRRVRRAPQVAYDSPQNNSDGQATSDNMDMFNGAPDRYEWNIVGKKELYIPYNNYKLHSKSLTYKELIQPGHINSDLVRYELHRVWVVEGVLKDSARHVYKKRVFYIDEDTWQISVADHYDGRGELWRVAQAYHINFYGDQVPWYTAEAIYDLMSGRYLVSGLSNEITTPFTFGGLKTKKEFNPAALRRKGGKH